MSIRQPRGHCFAALCVGAILATVATADLRAFADERPAAGSVRSAALDVVETQVRSAFGDIKHIHANTLAALLRVASDRVVLLDVRTADEFALSHMAGAIRVDPDARRTSEIVRLAGPLDGKIVVAYCSIGLRSSRLLVRLNQALREKGAVELANLSGGLFRWRNEQRPLVNATGQTAAIHPNNALWRQFLVDDPSQTAKAD